MRGETSKPCHGCGKQVKRQIGGRPTPFRPAEGVCAGCREQLDDYGRMKSILDAEQDLREVVLPWSFWNPPIALPFVGSRSFEEDRDNPVRTSERMFARLLRKGLAVRTWEDDGKPWNPADKDTHALVPRRAYRLFWMLHRAVGLALERAHENGVTEGHSWLVRLAEGSVSVEDFNRVTIKVKQTI